LVKGIAGFGGIDSLIQGKTKDLIRVHPIDPAAIPNYVRGMEDVLPPSCPESIFQDDHLRLMDAGMSNNLPIYPLLRPGRDVDIIVSFDASADIKQENWLPLSTDTRGNAALKAGLLEQAGRRRMTTSR